MKPRLHKAVDAGLAENLGQFIRALADELRAHNIPTPDLDARLLVCHACGLTHEEAAACPERPLSTAEREIIALATARRCAREPVSRITGKREFWGLDFAIAPSSLDPRSDTETLVQGVLELAAERASGASVSILDLGTGSGCVLIALLHELTRARGVGADINPATLRVAAANAQRHGVAGRAGFVCSSWSEPIGGTFDFVVSNPPYIPSGDIASLEPEVVRYDPRCALDGGDDGLKAYRAIMGGIEPVLSPGGWAVFEIGAGQHGPVKAMFGETGGGLKFDEVRQWRDLSGHVRCVAGRRLRTL